MSHSPPFLTTVLTRGPAPRLLHRIVAAGNLRYVIITSWALALALEVRPAWVLAWWSATMASGYLRGLVETWARRTGRPRLRVATAALSCIPWAAAPLLAWFDGQARGDALAVLLITCGYLLVFTQMRAQPREALIVSSPYSVAVAVILAATWGGHEFAALLTMAPVLTLVLVIKVVVTQMKDAELQNVNDSQRLLIADLELARDQATAASEAKSNFLAVMSHELRTPLNGVLGGAQLLAKAPLAESERAYLDIIRDSGDTLLSLLNDILDLAKIEAGKLELRPRDTTLRELVQHAIGPFEAQAEAKGLSLKTELRGEGADALFIDTLRVGQIVQNLLSNAIKFTSQGQVSLTVTSDPLSAEVSRLTFAVADQGIGIAPNDVARLFQPFTQVDDSSTRAFGGTGLGLSISRRLARLMGGDIAVRSQPGRGSTFTLSLETARLDGATDPVLTVSTAARASGEGLRVLIAEDHPVNRLLLESWLQSNGHQTTAAETGGEALVQAALQGFDLILMDVNMPEMDGLTATHILRSQKGRNAETPVIVLSASAREDDLKSGLAAGADAYLTKPIDFGKLAAALELTREGREALSAVDFASAA